VDAYDVDNEGSKSTYENCQTSKIIYAEILKDNIPEPDEHFTVTLMHPRGLTLGDYTSLTYTILKNP